MPGKGKDAVSHELSLMRLDLRKMKDEQTEALTGLRAELQTVLSLKQELVMTLEAFRTLKGAGALAA